MGAVHDVVEITITYQSEIQGGWRCGLLEPGLLHIVELDRLFIAPQRQVVDIV